MRLNGHGLFESIFKEHNAVMLLIDPESKNILDGNEAAVRFYGYSLEELLRLKISDINTLSEDELRAKMKEAILQEQDSFIFKHRLRNGETRDVESHSAPIKYEGKTILLSIIYDISQRIESEEELKRLSTRLKLATRAGGVGVWEYDVINNNLIWDDQMYVLYGIERTEFSHSYEAWNERVHPDDTTRWDKEIEMAIRGEKELDSEFRVCWGDGTVRNIRGTAIVQRDEAGKAMRLIGTNWDITKQKQTENDLINTNEQLSNAVFRANILAQSAEAANLSKSRFLANMSHEIRTPMNGIIGFLELLNTSSLSAEQREYIREAKSASEVLLYLINDILDFSKIEAGKLTLEKISFRLRTAIEDGVSLLVPKANEKNIGMNLMIKADVPEAVIGDPSRLRQILNNLISNAVKFTEKGEILITVDCVEEENEIALLRFEVKDTGIGIKKEDIRKLFQSFNQADASTTRKYGGTGLGLAISKELVKLMEGDIWVESEPGVGSAFIFQVRLKIAEKAVSRELIFKELDGVNVLVVDDNGANRKISSSYLEAIGCRVTEAVDAASAIAAIITSAGTEDKIKLAIVDNQMPGMSGYEMVTTLKTIPLVKDVKYILSSSVGQIGDADEARKVGFSGYLSKPIRRDELINCVSAVIGISKDSDIEPIVTKHLVKENLDKKKPKILLAEDNETNRKVIIAILKTHGLACDVAMDGKNAYQAVLKKDYDIVFMDCQMPLMDGYEATRRIRNAEDGGRHTTIIAMTANAMAGDRELCIKSGMDEYLSKPINFDEMFALIEKYSKYKTKSIKSHSSLNKYLECFIASTGLPAEDAEELYGQYLDYLPMVLTEIREAVQRDDFEKLRTLTHQLKGSSGNLSLTPVYELTKRMEIFINGNHEEDFAEAVGELEEIIEGLLKVKPV